MFVNLNLCKNLKFCNYSVKFRVAEGAGIGNFMVEASIIQMNTTKLRFVKKTLYIRG